MSKNQLPKGLITFLSKYESKVELILWIFFLLTLLPLYEETEPSFMFVGISLSTLSIFYFLMALVPQDDSQIIRIISVKVVNIGSSVCLIGIMYKILGFPSADIMVSIGLMSMISAGAAIILTSLNSWNEKTTRLALRIILIGVMGFVL